jgi:uncharacterized protein (DUF2062 family)
MLFKARKKVDLITRFLSILWPRNGWKRFLKYISLRIKRLPGTPHSIALGFTFGVMAAMTPLFGLHFIIGIVLAWIFGVSIIASIIGNFIGNPWTFPFICILNLKIGSIFYDSGNISDLNMKLISSELYLLWNAFYTFFIQLNFDDSSIFLSELQLIPSMFLGSIFTILLISGPCYFITKFIINNYKKNKLKLLNKKIKE